MSSSMPSFPRDLPDGYQLLADETGYDPDLHLKLEFPDRIWSLDEFGYSQREIANCASPVAVTSAFRVLSDEGVRVLYQVASRLQSVCSNIEGSRVPRHLAGGVYRSKFLRDICACPVILAHLSTISGTELAPHTMPSQQLYINYAPTDVSKAVDAWHYDGIGFDYVIMISDPAGMKGGNFEYFQGTREEVASMYGLQVHQVRYGVTGELPADRVIKAKFPAAGYAIFQQGNMVVHRAARLLEPADRITMVPGQVSKNTSVPDPTARHDMPGYGEPGIAVELARHSAWFAQSRLNDLMHNLPISSNPEMAEQALHNAVADIAQTIQYLHQK